MDDLPSSPLRNGQATAPADVASSAGDVLTGRPFFGTLFRKSGRGKDPVHIATIPEEKPITFAEARDEIEGFYGDITLHTISEGEHIRITFNAGAGRGNQKTGAPQREPTTSERTEWIQKGRQQAHQEFQDRLKKKEEHYQQRIEHLEERVDHYRELRSDAEDEKIRLKQQHQGELEELRQRHQDEISRLRARLEELRDEKNQLYIENRLSQSQGSTLDRLIESLAERAPDLLQTITNARSRMLPASSESSAVGRPNPSSPASPQSSSQGHNASPSDKDEPSHTTDATQDAVEQVRTLSKKQLMQAMADNAVAAAAGQVPAPHLDGAVRVALQVLEERGEAMDMNDWSVVVEQLAEGALEHELSAESVAEAIRPIVRRFVPAGSMAEKMLRGMPAEQATGMLIDATGRDPAEPVRTLIAGVLARFKETL